MACQMKVLEWRRLRATSDEERRRVAERATRKKKIVKKKHEKMCQVVRLMEKSVTGMRDSLKT